MWGPILLKQICYLSEKKVFLCKVGQKKRNTPIYFNTNYRTEMKLIPIIMDYYLLQFDALKLLLGVRLYRGSQTNFNFFNVNTPLLSTKL